MFAALSKCKEAVIALLSIIKFFDTKNSKAARNYILDLCQLPDMTVSGKPLMPHLEF